MSTALETSTDHENSGARRDVSPGARMVTIVTTRFTAARMMATATMPMPRMSRSGPWPRKARPSGIGELRAHPLVTLAPLTKGEATTRTPPATSPHRARGWRRGKASREAPIWSGTRAVPRPNHRGARNKKTPSTP